MGAYEASTGGRRPPRGGAPWSADPAPLAPLPSPNRHPHRRRNVLLVVLAVLCLSLAGLLVAETRTSHLQAREISRYAAGLDYRVAPGKSDRIVYPAHGPFDIRLGYDRLGHFEERLRDADFEIERQARFSPALMDFTRRGFNPPYDEKTGAGLSVLECRGEPLYAFDGTQHQYAHFDAIPPLVLKILLFIENRQLLDADAPHANPAVDWPRFTRAAFSQLGQALHLPGQSAGGSTLATQIEKYRHSPLGLTGSPTEKLRQMVSASVRSYRNGPQTLPARQDVALDYLNSVPLAGVPGHGEVHGLGEGLWAWFGADVDTVNRLMVPGLNDADALEARGLALRQVVALMIAQRRPSWYLGAGRDALERLTDSHLRLIAEAGLVDAEWRDAALAERLAFRDHARAPIRHRVPDDKGLRVARGRLGGLLGVSHYALDRLDLEARTTLDGALQASVTDYLRRLGDPTYAAEVGLVGDYLLSPDQAPGVHYSFTLMERDASGFRVRVQTDNGAQPFDLNEGSKLELGSTAKLRVLATYLEVIAELHERHAGQPADTLRRFRVDRQDALSRWVIDRLLAEPAIPLDRLLEEAMARRYSASPHEAFFTGGGRHTFGNFRREDDGRVPTLSEAMRESLNLPFVRLLRDLVQYQVHHNADRRALLEDDADPRRQDYLQAFADREGRVYLERFWRKYRDLDGDARLATFLASVPANASRLAAVHRYLFPEADTASLADLLETRLGEAPSAERVAELHAHYGPGRFDLNDQGYVARVHPLELWLVGYLLDTPHATLDEAAQASRQQRQDVYGWLFKTRHRQARDSRIRTMLEVEAFMDIHRRWQRLGYPFPHLVPSLATAVGASGDRPAALAELMGIILNDGVRQPTLRIDDLHFAAGTPYETRFVPAADRAVQVMAPEVAATLRETLAGVVEGGTARRLQGVFLDEAGAPRVLGGKTGTGNNRIETVGRGGQVIDSRARNRTATFVFYLGERHFGTLTAYVPGGESDAFRFTSALPVQALKGMAPLLSAHLEQGGDCRSRPSPDLLVAGP